MTTPDPNPFPNLSLAYQWVRAWWYRANAVIAALAVAYGVATEEKIGLWVALITSLFSTGLAIKNTSTKRV